jgi:hypothetical protein
MRCASLHASWESVQEVPRRRTSRIASLEEPRAALRRPRAAVRKVGRRRTSRIASLATPWEALGVPGGAAAPPSVTRHETSRSRGGRRASPGSPRAPEARGAGSWRDPGERGLTLRGGDRAPRSHLGSTRTVGRQDGHDHGRTLASAANRLKSRSNLPTALLPRRPRRLAVLPSHWIRTDLRRIRFPGSGFRLRLRVPNPTPGSESGSSPNPSPSSTSGRGAGPSGADGFQDSRGSPQARGRCPSSPVAFRETRPRSHRRSRPQPFLARTPPIAL